MLASSTLIPSAYSFDEASILMLVDMYKRLIYKHFDEPYNINDRFDNNELTGFQFSKQGGEESNGPVEILDFMILTQFCAASWKISRGNTTKFFTRKDLEYVSNKALGGILDISKRAVEISEGFKVRACTILRAIGKTFQIATIFPPQTSSSTTTIKSRRNIISSPFVIEKYFNDDLMKTRRDLLNMISGGEIMGGSTSEWSSGDGNAARIYSRSGMGEGMSSKNVEERKARATKVEVGRVLMYEATKNIKISWIGKTPDDAFSTAEATRIKKLEGLTKEDKHSDHIYYSNDFMKMRDASDEVLIMFADKIVDLMYEFYSAIVDGFFKSDELKNTLNVPYSEPEPETTAADSEDQVGFISSAALLLILKRIYGIDTVNDKNPMSAIITKQQPGGCKKGSKLALLKDFDIVNTYFLTNYKNEDPNGKKDRIRISPKAMVSLKSVENGIPPSFYDQIPKHKYDFCPAPNHNFDPNIGERGEITDEAGKNYVRNSFILDAVKAFLKNNNKLNWILSVESCDHLVDVSDYLVRYLSLDMAIKTARFTHCRVEMDKLETGIPMTFSDYSLFQVTTEDVETAHAAIIRNVLLGTTCQMRR